MPSLSDTDFSSLLCYAPRGQGEVARKSKRIVWAAKSDSFVGPRRILTFAAERLEELLPETAVLQACFPKGAVAVPVPRAAPLVPGGLWPTLRLCEELRAAGVVADLRPLLDRVRPVTKSATAASDARPTAELHAASMAVSGGPSLHERGPFCLVDDVITRGATLVAAAAVLQAAFPEAGVTCFALVRTISKGEILDVLSPVAGTIRLRPDGSTHREP